MSAPMHRFTHLARVFDPRLRSHQIVLVIAAGSAALSFAFGGGPFDAVFAAGAAGLGWAIAREIAPDHVMPSFYAALGAGVFQVLVGGVGIGTLYLVLVFLRILVRTTGAAPKTSDLAGNLLVALFFSSTLPGLIAALGIATALWLSPILPRPGPKDHRIWAVGYAIVPLVGFALSPPPTVPDSTGAGWLLFSISVLASIGLFGEARPTSVGDIDREPLDGARLRLGRLELVTLLVVMAVATLGSANAVVAPAWWAVMATGVRQIRDRSSS